MRKAGVLLPLSALPSPHGIGTLGQAAYDFVDFLAEAKQSYWQILPVGPTGYGDSPYQSFSAFAGSPYLIDLDLLCQEGLLRPEEIPLALGQNPLRVDYALLYQKRFAVLYKAVRRLDKAGAAYQDFCQENHFWLEDYCLFMAIKENQQGKSFHAWPQALRRRNRRALQTAALLYRRRVEFWRCLQFFFYRQWQALKTYANHRGIGIVGDAPIYVSDDSSDLWANPHLFQLDGDGRLARVAGVPPDAFSDTGQLWGNPLYDWKAHKREGYGWWISRLRQASKLFDVTRIDHFRGFADYYGIPAGAATAQEGQWVDGPGESFILAVQKALPHMEIIAEDLGILNQKVYDLLAFSGYPGMKILQFAFDAQGDSSYLPHHHVAHCVIYTGTHDNNTSKGWEKECSPQDEAFARAYLGIEPEQSLTEALIRAALQSPAETAIVPLWDWLELDEEARFNKPSTSGLHNWSWRLQPGQLKPYLAGHMADMTVTYRRQPPKEEDL